MIIYQNAYFGLSWVKLLKQLNTDIWFHGHFMNHIIWHTGSIGMIDVIFFASDHHKKIFTDKNKVQNTDFDDLWGDLFFVCIMKFFFVTSAI